ncbi:MAG: TIGR01777 family oxidoreductase [Acidobacteriota bacterium]
MNVLISGASGLVGRALTASLRSDGHQVRRLVRRQPVASDAAFWDPAAGVLAEDALDGIDGVVHLAGENIAGGRWTRAFKQRVLDSRVAGTRLISEAVASCDVPPTLISASAIGFYGDRGAQRVDEDAPSGEGFLAEVCRQWEAATQPAEDAGARVVKLRIGVVLSTEGGALQRMLTPFKFGLGGVVGNGRQVVSWIHLIDLVAAIEVALEDPELSGPVNAVAPEPVTQRELARTLGRVLGRPTLAPLPAIAVRMIFGEMGQELLLASTRVAPKRLEATAFPFRFETLEPALRHELGS